MCKLSRGVKEGKRKRRAGRSWTLRTFTEQLLKCLLPETSRCYVLKNTSTVSHYFASSVQDTEIATPFVFRCDNLWPSDVTGHNGQVTATLTRQLWLKWMRDEMKQHTGPQYNKLQVKTKIKMKSLPSSPRRRVVAIGVQLHSFLTPATDGGFGRFTQKRGTHWIGGWVGPTVGLDDTERRKIYLPRQDLNPWSSSL